MSQIIVTSRYLKNNTVKTKSQQKYYTRYIATRESVEVREQRKNILEKRLKEIDKARNDFVNLIATGACGADSLDNEFAEEEKLSEKLLVLKSQNQAPAEMQSRLENVLREIENTRFELVCFNDVIIRNVIECIKVLNKTEILIIFGRALKSESSVFNLRAICF